MAALRRKPRTPFPYVLRRDRALPEAEQPRFIIAPPSGRVFAEIVDDARGELSGLIDIVIRCVERLENHPDAQAFGAANSPQRTQYVEDAMDVMVIRELGNAVGDTLLGEADRKNSDSPSVLEVQTGGAPVAADSPT